MVSSPFKKLAETIRRSGSNLGLNSQNDSTPQVTPENSCLFEAFEWNVPADQKHWQRLEAALESLKEIGIDQVWLPPGCKATHPGSNGYDVYDLWDLGEFDQKGSVSTKWGTKDELCSLSNKAQELGVGFIWDAVLNHKAGADATERCHAVEVEDGDRNMPTCSSREIEAWLSFDFPGRGDKYSQLKYHAEHFSGTDMDAMTNKKAIYRTAKSWSSNVDGSEKGNYDYLMFSNVDYSHPDVRADVLSWALWIPTQAPLLGMRFDAARHFDYKFLLELISSLRASYPEQRWLFVGEYWQDSLTGLRDYLKRMKYNLSLFDAPLLYNFHRSSKRQGADLRRIFHYSLVHKEPDHAITVVTNHDTQPGQALNVPVAPPFQILAYALILLREKGHPCVFYGDLYGLQPGDGHQGYGPACGGKLPDLLMARKIFSYGVQHDYLDEKSLIGWTREGTWDRPYGLAVVGSNGGPGTKRMYVGKQHAGETWTDLWQWDNFKTTISDDGFGEFGIGGDGVNVYVKDDAQGRERFGQFNTAIYDLC